MLFNAPYSQRPLGLRSTVFIIPGAILVALLALSLGRLAARRRTLPPEGAAFALLAAAAFAVHLPISAYVRMLIPVVPLVVWLVVFGLRSDSVEPASAAERDDRPEREPDAVSTPS